MKSGISKILISNKYFSKFLGNANIEDPFWIRFFSKPIIGISRICTVITWKSENTVIETLEENVYCTGRMYIATLFCVISYKFYKLCYHRSVVLPFNCITNHMIITDLCINKYHYESMKHHHTAEKWAPCPLPRESTMYTLIYLTWEIWKVLRLPNPSSNPTQIGLLRFR